MITAITQAAHRLDHWLQDRLGRPYRVILSIGLTEEIIRRISELPDELKHAKSLIGISLMIMMNLALLVNQLGEISHRRAARLKAGAARHGTPGGGDPGAASLPMATSDEVPHDEA